MTDKPERITILCRSFTAAALEYHRGRMAEKGYRMEGGILERQFQLIEGEARPVELFDGDMLYAVNFILKTD